MPDLQSSWPWLTLAALGAFHGLNPAMGWLFAVALGLQERKLRAVISALGPIALGHALSIGVAAVVIGALGLVLPSGLLLMLGGIALLGFAAYKVISRFRHPRWVGMRVTPRQLVFWSFVMASAHGAGLMLVPLLVELQGVPIATTLAATPPAAHLGHAAHLGQQATASGSVWWPTLLAVGLHSGAMLAVAAAIAMVVYLKVGVEILRRAWINLDFLWVGALAVAGVVALALSVGPLLAG